MLCCLSVISIWWEISPGMLTHRSTAVWQNTLFHIKMTCTVQKSYHQLFCGASVPPAELQAVQWHFSSRTQPQLWLTVPEAPSLHPLQMSHDWSKVLKGCRMREFGSPWFHCMILLLTHTDAEHCKDFSFQIQVSFWRGLGPWLQVQNHCCGCDWGIMRKDTAQTDCANF